MNLTLPSTFVERIQDLSPGAIKAYLALAWLKAHTGSTLTQTQIAAQMSVSERSVVTYLKELERAGYLQKRRVECGRGRNTEYVLLTELAYGVQ